MRPSLRTILFSGTPAPAPAPTISSISPSIGDSAGSSAVTITGTNFVGGATVTIGGVSCTSVSVVSGTSITCVTGAHASGAVNIVVTNPDSQSATLSNGYTYFSPSDVSGIKMWLDASSTTNLYTDTGLTTNVTADGQSVKGWKDKSSNSYSPTEGASPPTYKASIKNGLGVVRFDGINDILKGPSAMSNIASTTAYTMYFVISVKSFNSFVDTPGSLYNNECVASENSGGDFNVPINNYPLIGATNYHSGNNELRKPIAANNWYILQVRHESNVLYAQINDEPETSVTSLTTDSLTGVLNLGADSGRAQFAEVDMAEIISYSVAVSSPNRASILSYLNSKWNVYAANQYTPASTYGLTLWLKNTISGSDGDVVGSWTDSSPLAHNLTQSTLGNKPTLRLAVKNGLSVVRFDGVDDYMDTAAATSTIITATAMGAWFVYTPKSFNSNAAQGYNNEDIWTNVTRGDVSLYLKSNSGSPQVGFESAGAQHVLLSATANSWYVTHLRHDSGTIYISNNGGSEASTASGSTTVTNPLRLGGNFDASQCAEFDLAEVVFFNFAPNAAEQSAMLSYLNTKWVVY